MEAGVSTFVFEVFGFISSDEAARLVVEVPPVPALEAAALEAPDLVAEVFLRVPVAPLLEAAEARFAVFLAIERRFYQIRILISNTKT